MLNTYIRVSSAQISHAGREINELLNTIPGLIRELEASLQRLNGCWEGAAWDSFQSNAALQIEMLTEVYQYMKQFSAGMESAATQYKRAEQDVCAKL